MSSDEAGLTFREQMKGFPYWQVGVLAVIRFAEPIAFTSPFPYLFFMVRSFGIKEDDISRYCGYLSSIFAFFQFLFCVQWGHISDRIGRKLVLIIGLSGTAISILIFGFSTNIYMALFARGLMGSINGNVAVVRTMLGENAVEKRHQALALSVVPLLWQVGCIIGPLSGYLVDSDILKDGNNEQFILGNGGKKTLFEKYPFALSNLVVAFFLIVSLIVTILFLNETCEGIKDKRDVGLEIGDKIRRSLGFDVPVRPWQVGYVSLAATRSQESARRKSSGVNNDASVDIDEAPVEPLTTENFTNGGDLQQRNVSFQPIDEFDEDELSDAIGSDEDDDDDVSSVESIGMLSRRTSIALIRTYSIQSNNIKDEMQRNNETGYAWDVLLKPSILMTLIFNFSLSCHSVVFDEFIPVLLSSNVARISGDDKDADDVTMPLASHFPFKILGGFGWDSKEVGRLLSATGLVGVAMVLIVYPYIDRNCNTVRCLRFFAVWFIPIYFLLPYLVLTLPPNISDYRVSVVATYTIALLRALAASITFPQITLLIHRYSPSNHRAFVNGTALSVSSLARFVGPLVWGYLMSFSQTNSIGWLTWWSVGLISIVSYILTLKMDEKEEDEEDDIEVGQASFGDGDSNRRDRRLSSGHQRRRSYNNIAGGNGRKSSVSHSIRSIISNNYNNQLGNIDEHTPLVTKK
ncbi:hypothetical protein BVG19_g3879 [[Candida] boidinii]|nr:hypothetical protein BVG19_g3879 [[Candida] boidinii]OWB52657.1 hypothetical protein B5S27_g4236 [[Candida] boidinii]OWB85289.1 hypothetical protein B5S33_g3952 [[Candida] boidinii]